jgi:hypothetical protein
MVPLRILIDDEASSQLPLGKTVCATTFTVSWVVGLAGMTYKLCIIGNWAKSVLLIHENKSSTADLCNFFFMAIVF